MRSTLQNKLAYLFTAVIGLLNACSSSEPSVNMPRPANASNNTELVALGKQLFFDASLSSPPGQSCSTCHDPNTGFAAPAGKMLHGIVPDVTGTKFGFRNAPTAAYAAFSPPFHYDAEPETYVGGHFLDQRADSLEEQAAGPFLNPLEMANPNKQTVVNKVASASYAAEFRRHFGEAVFANTDQAYTSITRAIAAFERSPELNAFSSKYDAYLRGKAELAPQEQRGLALFEDDKKGNCAACHPSQVNDGLLPLFTDFTNDNIGLGRNPNNPFYTMPADINPDGAAFIDKGLGANPKLKDAKFDGRFKVPTLRNVAVTGPYTHNGAIAELKDVVRFYASSCKPGNPDNWPAPEVVEGKNCDELGDLPLDEQDIDDIVAFLETLTDGYN